MSALTDRVAAEHRAIDWTWWPDRVFCACTPAVSRMRVAYARHVARATEDALLAEVERLADEFERTGITCACGHYVGGEHNGNGCYAVITYSPLVRCSCTSTDGQDEDAIVAARLRALIATPSEPGAGRHAHGAWCVTDCPDKQAARDGGER